MIKVKYTIQSVPVIQDYAHELTLDIGNEITQEELAIELNRVAGFEKILREQLASNNMFLSKSYYQVRK